MPNTTILYTQIITFIGYLAVLFYLYRIYVQQKDSTIQSKDATIELLKERITGLEKEIGSLKDLTPDILLDRYFKRIEMLESEVVKLNQLEAELLKLNQDDEANRTLITQKEAEIDVLKSFISSARELIDELSVKAANAEECPHCGAMLESMGTFDDFESHALVTMKRYTCGYSEGDGYTNTKCSRTNKQPVDNS